MLYYGYREIGVYAPTVYLLWPTGRLGGIIQLPLAGIRAIGTGFHPLQVVISLAQGLAPSPGFWLLILTDDRKLVIARSPDYSSSNPQISIQSGMLADLADARAFPQLAGFTPTDVAQSPRPPFHIFISGVVGAGNRPSAQSQVHEFDVGMSYVGMPFSTRTLNVDTFVGHLKDIDFLSDGRLVGLMTPASDQPGGIFAIDLATGAMTRLMQSDISLGAMSVLRGDQRDVFYIERFFANGIYDPINPRYFPRIEHYDANALQTSLSVFSVETISVPGAPGLVRLDGAWPGSNAPRITYDGQDLPNLQQANGLPVAASYPALGSFAAPVTANGTGFESLVFGSSALTLYCQGGTPGAQAQIWTAAGGNAAMGGVVPPADSAGQSVATIDLAPGFTTLYVQTADGGPTPDLLQRHVLYIPQS